MKREPIPPAVPAKDYLLKRLQDPATAAAYLNASVEDDDPGAFLQALRNVTDAQGGIGKVANLAGLNRQQLYRTLSERGNPELRSLVKILSASGLRLEVMPKEQPPASRRRGGAASSSRTSKGTKTASRTRVPTPA
jgi:probable addiction module antidote protein